MVTGPTEEELEFLANKRFLVVKNHISEKIIKRLAEIERRLHDHIGDLEFQFPKGTFLKAGKISKGEQYRDLPYFILDYPRLFTRNKIFAYRVMLWWGHHFSTTLHLQGASLEYYQEAILKSLSQKEYQSTYFCVNHQPWDYHYESDNYRKIGELSKKEIEKHIADNGFIKISDYISVTAWDEFENFTLKSFARFLHCL